MRSFDLLGFLCLLATAGFAFTGCADEKAPDPKKDSTAGAPAKGDAVSFSKDVLPVFVRSCGACHRREGGNEEAVEHKVYYETKEDVLGKVGKHIIPGKPQESGLLKILDQTQPVSDAKIVMPPPGSSVPAWSRDELDLFSRWVQAGAGDN
jgi:mono/diheme cytochrome c family protein